MFPIGKTHNLGTMNSIVLTGPTLHEEGIMISRNLERARDSDDTPQATNMILSERSIRSLVVLTWAEIPGTPRRIMPGRRSTPL